jgi:hypothetical protein
VSCFQPQVLFETFLILRKNERGVMNVCTASCKVPDIPYTYIRSFISLSHDRSEASSKASSLYRDWLRAGRSGDRIPVMAEIFRTVQTGPVAHPASCTMDTRSFPGVKRPWRGADHPLPSNAEFKRAYSYTYTRLWAFGSVIGYLYLLPH